jgi:hypothetical protein
MASRMKITMLSLVAALACAPACTSSDGGGSLTIADTPLAGKAYGQPWTFVSGKQSAGLASFYSVAWDCTQFGDPTGTAPTLLTSLPTTPGEYDLGFGTGKPTVTFVQPPSTNSIAVQGKIRIDMVTATEITGGLVAKVDGNNSVSGTFMLSICPAQ